MTTNQENFYDQVISLLKQRGVTLDDIEELVYFLQKDYISPLTHEAMRESIEKVLQKREVQNSIFTGIELDRLAEEKKLSQPLQSIMERDESLYGCDEILTFSITNLYGSIGFTNYGYIDKLKPGILAKLNDHSTGKINVFLDDLVGAIAAAAASRLAHTQTKFEDDNSIYR
ncbi:phosphatidylglycerophosphatase A [Lactobacillus psittaci]|uniref:Phosphatidylglycerophosphatase A n=1 Tax=Lactobacillus psittaci DSM 15354 TaxID=1122152 RepID=A0A0R1S9A5_9LACO|nr:phosphatidylglycerophosphatase A [Lactobacillus psittaci]KRL63029.1 phosphatidylglycerophosphatase A [Lactobacillus psittaci DSM 15354]